MAEEVPKETLLEKMADKIKRHDSSSSSSSSDSDSDDKKVFKKVDDKIEAVKDKVFRIFGREKPVHTVLGAGKRTVTVFISFHDRFSCDLWWICKVKLVSFFRSSVGVSGVKRGNSGIFLSISSSS